MKMRRWRMNLTGNGISGPVGMGDENGKEIGQLDENFGVEQGGSGKT